MTKQAGITYQDSTLVISGDLDCYTVTKVWRSSLPLLLKQSQLQFDFSQVKSANSAGLALIIEWLRYAEQHNKAIHFSHLPSQLLSIAHVSGVDQLLQ